MTFSLRLSLLATCALVAIATTTPARAGERVETIPTRSGVTEGLYVIEAKGTPWATAILYVGGNGKMALGDRGPTDLQGNFLLRIAEQLSNAGIALVYPDTPSDKPRGLGNARTEPGHAKDGQAVLQWVRQRSNAPIFLIGTSRGTISVVNIASTLEPGAVAGVVLTSSLMAPSRKFNAIDGHQLGAIRAPTLVMHHKRDGCNVTQPGEVPQLMDGLKAAPRKDLVWIDGGLPAKSGPCDGKSAHGYFGVEAEATKALVGWMKATVAR